jgi:uncharacterized membrane protein
MIPPRTRTAVLHGLLLTLSAGWLLATAAAPFLMARGSKSAPLVYAVFSPLCHQDPGRCFRLAGFPLAVCARCTGVYFGFVLGLLLWPFAGRPSRPRLPSARAFLAATLPIALDGAGNAFGIWASPPGLRFAVGAVWGILLPFYGQAGLASLFAPRPEKK